MEQQTQVKGGKRAGSGRKPKYGEATKPLNMRVPESKHGKLKKAIEILLTEDYLDRFLYDMNEGELS
jgi:hypothetical protein